MVTKEQIEAWRAIWRNTYSGLSAPAEYQTAFQQLNEMCDLALKASPEERKIDPRYAGRDPAAEYARRNPLGGPAKVFIAMAERIRAGEEFYSVLDDYGFQVKLGFSDGGVGSDPK